MPLTERAAGGDQFNRFQRQRGDLRPEREPQVRTTEKAIGWGLRSSSAASSLMGEFPCLAGGLTVRPLFTSFGLVIRGWSRRVASAPSKETDASRARKRQPRRADRPGLRPKRLLPSPAALTALDRIVRRERVPAVEAVERALKAYADDAPSAQIPNDRLARLVAERLR